MALEKIVFDHSVITSQFLNDLQDAVIELQNTPRLLIFNERESRKFLPTAVGTNVSGLETRYLTPNVTPRKGDILYGNQSNYLAEVQTVSGTSMTAAGTGNYIY